MEVIADLSNVLEKLKISKDQLDQLIEIQQKYNVMKEKRKAINKVAYKKWRDNIDEEDYKARRKLSNAKYNQKLREIKQMQKEGM